MKSIMIDLLQNIYFVRYQSMLPVLKMASVHNVELVKFFFKLLYQADNRRTDFDGKYLFQVYVNWLKNSKKRYEKSLLRIKT